MKTLKKIWLQYKPLTLKEKNDYITGYLNAFCHHIRLGKETIIERHNQFINKDTILLFRIIKKGAILGLWNLIEDENNYYVSYNKSKIDSFKNTGLFTGIYLTTVNTIVAIISLFLTTFSIYKLFLP